MSTRGLGPSPLQIRGNCCSEKTNKIAVYVMDNRLIPIFKENLTIGSGRKGSWVMEKWAAGIQLKSKKYAIIYLCIIYKKIFTSVLITEIWNKVPGSFFIFWVRNVGK